MTQAATDIQALTLQAGGRDWPATRMTPAGEGPFPGVVVIHDITGFREDTLRHCRKFVEAGYATIAPDLYADGTPRCVVSTLAAMPRGKGVALDVIEAARTHLADQPAVDGKRIAVTGFCMGGGFALLAGADGAYAASAPFYGPVPQSHKRLKGLCPTLAQYGGQDLLFRREHSRLSRHLKTLGIVHEVIVYPEAGHSFMNDHPDPVFATGRYTPLRARYEPEVEARAWTRLLAFLGEHV